MLRGICVIFVVSYVRGLHIRPVRSLSDALVYATLQTPVVVHHRDFACERPPPPKKYHPTKKPHPKMKVKLSPNVEVVRSIEMEYDSALGKFVPVRQDARPAPEVPLLSPKTMRDLGEIFRKFEKERRAQKPGSTDAKNFLRGRYKHAGFPEFRTEPPQTSGLFLGESTKHPKVFNFYYRNWQNGILASERPRFHHFVVAGVHGPNARPFLTS